MVTNKETADELQRLQVSAFNTQKPSRSQCIDILESMTKDIDSEYFGDIVKLYAYFNGRPKAPKKAKTVFQWVARAVSTDDVRKFMQVVLVEENRMAATDGRRLHVAPNIDKLPAGKYSADGRYLCSLDSTDCGTFPNIDRVIPDTADMQFAWVETPSQLTAEPGSNRTDLQPIEHDEAWTISFNRTFLEDASYHDGTIIISASAPDKATIVTPTDAPKDMYAVIMPMAKQ